MWPTCISTQSTRRASQTASRVAAARMMTKSVIGRRPRLEGLVPLVALVDDPGEPEVDPHDQRIEPHPRALREVAELVGEHAGELLERDAGREGQADGEDQLAAQDAQRGPRRGAPRR